LCAQPLASLPEVSAEAVLEAKSDLAVAQVDESEADAAQRRAEQELAVATTGLDNAAAGVARCRAECERRQDRLDDLRTVLAPAFEDGVPEDPIAPLDERLRAVRDLVAAEKSSRSARDDARAAAGAFEERAAKVAVDVARIRGGLERGEIAAVVTRAQEAADLERAPVFATELPEDAGSLVSVVDEAADTLEALCSDLDELVAGRIARQASVAGEARRAIPEGLGITGETVADMCSSASAVARSLARDAALADRDAESMAARLSARAAMEEEISAQRREHAVYAELGKELKDDRIVQFLQAEALGVLAVAATERLRLLSGTRYRLVFEHDEFFVVDAWNGDEHRSVRTLSGGETFLASLALALALAEQVQSLAVSEKSKLESLFLDEGFGNLDAETLEVVVGAIEQLGGDGRLVGVITHVSDVAERMPVRLTITKSSGGSTIARAPVDALLG
jgi:exonuclease SbcC